MRLGGLGADRPGLGEGAATPEPLVSSLKHWPLTAKQPVGAGMNEWGKGERVGYQLRGKAQNRVRGLVAGNRRKPLHPGTHGSRE